MRNGKPRSWIDGTLTSDSVLCQYLIFNSQYSFHPPGNERETDTMISSNVLRGEGRNWGTQWLENLTEVAKLVSGVARIWIQAVWCQSPCSYPPGLRVCMHVHVGAHMYVCVCVCAVCVLVGWLVGWGIRLWACRRSTSLCEWQGQVTFQPWAWPLFPTVFSASCRAAVPSPTHSRSSSLPLWPSHSFLHPHLCIRAALRQNHEKKAHINTKFMLTQSFGDFHWDTIFL